MRDKFIVIVEMIVSGLSPEDVKESVISFFDGLPISITENYKIMEIKQERGSL